MKSENLIIELSFALILAGAIIFAGETVMANDAKYINKKFKVLKILDGEWPHPTIEISNQGLGIRVIGANTYSPPPASSEPRAIRMVLAFQLNPGKTRKDFARFKKVDAPWVASNRGSNSATIWTERGGDWIFDAFEDVTFASEEDFNRAYVGNDKLNKAAAGLFDNKVLVAIVTE